MGGVSFESLYIARQACGGCIARHLSERKGQVLTGVGVTASTLKRIVLGE